MLGAVERMNVRAEASALLRSLGDHPDRVAEHLEAHGVVGRVKSGTDCAVAVYLHALLGGERQVGSLQVSADSLILKLEGRRHGTVIVRLPGPVEAFVARFDNGVYPQLLQRALRGRRNRAAAEDCGL